MRRPLTRRAQGLLMALVVLGAGMSMLAGQAMSLSKGQTLYVPVYSHIYWGPKPRAFDLACTLSIRNVDPQVAITLTSVDYFNTDGKKIRSFLGKPVQVLPLGTKEYYIEETDKSGGSGASFLVKWTAGKDTNPPIVECVMIGVESSQGVSFTSRGRVLLDHK